MKNLFFVLALLTALVPISGLHADDEGMKVWFLKGRTQFGNEVYIRSEAAKEIMSFWDGNVVNRSSIASDGLFGGTRYNGHSLSCKTASVRNLSAQCTFRFDGDGRLTGEMLNEPLHSPRLDRLGNVSGSVKLARNGANLEVVLTGDSARFMFETMRDSQKLNASVTKIVGKNIACFLQPELQCSFKFDQNTDAMP